MSISLLCSYTPYVETPQALLPVHPQAVRLKVCQILRQVFLVMEVLSIVGPCLLTLLTACISDAWLQEVEQERIQRFAIRFLNSSLPVSLRRLADLHQTFLGPLDRCIITPVPVTECFQVFYSKLFAIPKPEWENCPILNFRILSVFFGAQIPLGIHQGSLLLCASTLYQWLLRQ